MDIDEIEETFEKTGVTPGHGISYVSRNKDICATIYGDGEYKRARVFYNRREGFESRKKLPCFYIDEKTLRARPVNSVSEVKHD